MTAASGAATGVGQAVGDLVRTRLGGSEHSRAALEAVAAAPQDPVAVNELQRALRGVLAEDPQFLTALVNALAMASAPVKQHTTTDSIVLGHSIVRGSNLALGNQSISNHHTSYGWFTAVAVLVA